MEKQVLFKYNDQMGHVGPAKTKEVNSRTYWFSNLNEKVDNYMRNCLKCISFSPTTVRAERYLHIFPKGNVPFATAHIDHFGPVDNSNAKVVKKYVFLVVDAFTTFVKLYATKTTSS
ncbi:uncharacterized protein LOC117178514 [Belonocnema kinseyi]|uniref:uncharacterized protein LOC117178514 n=1 Tax=Belonocnema kinseyi TaxID=2817044 RepID=UPI00143CC278|nr:uncharacterized protein LOC117178514 [Belonocnema kinseyi]